MMEVYATSLYHIDYSRRDVPIILGQTQTLYDDTISSVLLFLANKDAVMQAMFGEVIHRPNI